MPTFIVKVPAGLGILLPDDLPAVHHVRPPAGLPLLLPPLQGLYEVVAAVRADEARLHQARSKPEEQRGREKKCEYTAQNSRAFVNANVWDYMHVDSSSRVGRWEQVGGRRARGGMPISSKADPLFLCYALTGFHITCHLNKRFQHFEGGGEAGKALP